MSPRDKKPKPPLNTTGKAIVLADGRKIRNGQRRPFHKSTLEQQERITEFVADMLIGLAKPHEIKDAVRKEFNRQHRTAVAYIARAKKLLRKQAEMMPQDAKGIGVHVLLGVMRSGKPSERVAAERRFSEIYGYNAPTRSEITGPDGAPLTTVVAPQVSVMILDNGRDAAAGTLKDDPPALVGQASSANETMPARR